MNRRKPPSVVSFSPLFVSASTVAQFAQHGGIGGTAFIPSGAVVPGLQISSINISRNQSSQVEVDFVGQLRVR